MHSVADQTARIRDEKGSRIMNVLIMLSEFGIYDGETWCVWPTGDGPSRTTAHGWASAADAVAHWKSNPNFTAFANGRETSFGQMTGAVKVGRRMVVGPIRQRVWFEEAS
jgi:hypothetical protein